MGERTQKLIGSSSGTSATIPNPVKFLLGGTSGHHQITHPDKATKRLTTRLRLVIRLRLHLVPHLEEVDEELSNFHLRCGTRGITSCQASPKQIIFVRLRIAHSTDHSTILIHLCGSVCAVLFTQPLDLVKNRMQLSGEGGKVREHKTSFHAIRSIVEKEGPLGLYNGLSAGMARQATYTTARLGIYTWMFEKASMTSDGKPGNISFVQKAGIGMVAGAVASLIGTPTEVSLIRMTSDGRLPVEHRRNYSNVFNAMSRIAKEEGVFALWRGCGPTVLRAMVVNAAQLGTYSQVKQWLLESGLLKEHLGLYFTASMISGLATVSASMPVDIAKTRIQNMATVNGVPEYRGAIDVWTKVIRQEGLFSLWKGFTPAYARLGPHTVLVLVFLEQLNAAYYKYILGVEKLRGGL